MKINVTNIRPAWCSSAYKWQVWVSDAGLFEQHEYILQTLSKWFGDARYMWGNCFLCGKK